LSKLNKAHIRPNKAAKDRVKEFPTELNEESGLLFCRTCEVSVEHKRKSTITDHLDSKKHNMRKAKKSAHVKTEASDEVLMKNNEKGIGS
jgi:hypothetical protein